MTEATLVGIRKVPHALPMEWIAGLRVKLADVRLFHFNKLSPKFVSISHYIFSHWCHHSRTCNLMAKGKEQENWQNEVVALEMFCTKLACATSAPMLCGQADICREGSLCLSLGGKSQVAWQIERPGSHEEHIRKGKNVYVYVWTIHVII